MVVIPEGNVVSIVGIYIVQLAKNGFMTKSIVIHVIMASSKIAEMLKKAHKAVDDRHKTHPRISVTLRIVPVVDQIVSHLTISFVEHSR